MRALPFLSLPERWRRVVLFRLCLCFASLSPCPTLANLSRQLPWYSIIPGDFLSSDHDLSIICSCGRWVAVRHQPSGCHSSVSGEHIHAASYLIPRRTDSEQTVVSVSITSIYNIYFHPLREYPGPKLWASFRFIFVYYQLSGLLPLRVKLLHDEYGPVVRIAPDELSYNTAQAWKDIFGFRQGHRQLPKNLATMPPVGEGNPDDIIHGDDATHSRFRRLLSHAFSARALEDQQPVIVSYVDLLIQHLHENISKPQDMVAWLNWTTFDVIGDLTFGEPFDCLKNERYHPWVDTILGGINGGVAISATARYGLSSLLIWLIPKSMTEKFDLMHAYTREKVARRLQKGTDRPDFMSQLMRNDKERKEMTQAEMQQNALTLVVAGSETTATLLSGTMFHLLRNPEMLLCVRDEVRSAFPSERDIDCNSVNNMNYMIAILKEGMRIYPPDPSSIPRKVMNEADTIDGRMVPPPPYHSRPVSVGLQPLSLELPRPRRVSS